MARRQRRRSGRGALVEVAQMENLINHFGELVMDAAMNDRVPARYGNRDPDFVPQGVYPCAGNDKWVALSVRDNDEWNALVDVLGCPDQLSAPELTTRDGRARHHDEIDAIIGAWTATRPPDGVFHALQAAGVPAGPVYNEADAFSDPQLHERGFFQPLTHPSFGTYFYPAHNFTMSVTPPRIWRHAPMCGQDNEYVYRELLGLCAEEYDRLVADGHIGTVPD
jgi:crotonobetainyl-CoA:carnitine CoA-transferase CaiB-like acyl-CoA transferase